MIGMFNGSVSGRTRKNKGFVVLYHELRSYLKCFSASEWIVLTALALFADENGHSCPTISTLAEVTGLSARNVQQCLKSLSTGQGRGFVVLRLERRTDRTGRCTSNGYAILPDGFPDAPPESPANFAEEGAENDGEEGAENGTITTLKKIQKEVDPPIAPRGRGRPAGTVGLPKEDDPARLLYIAYRSARYGEEHADTFTLGEWRAAHHVVRSMQGAKVTPDQVAEGTANLISAWKVADMVTLNALWKHWTTSQVKRGPYSEAKRFVENVSNIYDSVQSIGDI